MEWAHREMCINHSWIEKFPAMQEVGSAVQREPGSDKGQFIGVRILH